jgi:LPS export ABC transporter protein LptC
MLIALLLAAIGCDDDSAGTDSAEVAEVDSLVPDQITSNAHIYLYKGGFKTTDLLADEIRQFTVLDSTIALNLQVEFYDSAGTMISFLTANEGYIREKDNYLAVSGSVVVINGDSVRLETEYLEWDGAKDSIVTDSFVTVIEGNADTLMSYGFQSDPAMREVTFKRQVSGRLTDIEKVEDEDK